MPTAGGNRRANARARAATRACGERAHLEFAEHLRRDALWHSMESTDHQTAWFDTQVLNRGPAHTLELHWSSFMGSYEQGMGNHPPDRLYAMDERHLLVEIPLDEDQA